MEFMDDPNGSQMADLEELLEDGNDASDWRS